MHEESSVDTDDLCIPIFIEYGFQLQLLVMKRNLVQCNYVLIYFISNIQES